MTISQRIICLTEESVETLYLLGKEGSIVGVSEYVERPKEAKSLPKVSQFVRSDVEAILALKPTLVLGFSDIQKDIARELIGKGLNVFVTNQRSIEEILDYIEMLGRMVGSEREALKITDSFRNKINQIKLESSKLPRRPKVYFEEWDHPRLSAIKWVSELIEICGGENIFKARSGALARDREVKDEEIITGSPDIILGCWCGKPVNIDKIKKRSGYEVIPAVISNQVWELPPEVFLQPGPALFLDGLDQMFQKIKDVALDDKK